MPFISLAVACSKAIHPARLWCKTPSLILLMAVLLGVGAALGLVGKADAGIIYIKNSTATSNIGTSAFYAENIAGASEGSDGTDSPFQTPTQTNALEIYSNPYGTKLMLDAHPIDTTGWDFDLAVKGSVSGIDNYLNYKITDTTDLTDKTIIIYDKAKYNPANPSTFYTLLMDNAYHNINLPALTASNTKYAHWRLDLTPEPATLALLGLGAATLIAGGRRKSKRAE